MGRLEDLRESLLDMDPEIVREKIRHIREDRRIVKTVEKMPATRRKKISVAAFNTVKGMTPAQKAKLLAELLKGG